MRGLRPGCSVAIDAFLGETFSRSAGACRTNVSNGDTTKETEKYNLYSVGLDN